MTSVTFDGAAKRFGSVTAVADFTLSIADGEFVVLVGASGSGKTTALRLLAGLEGLSAGHIFIGDECVDDVSPKDRDIAMVFQDYALYPQMTVYKNLAFGLRMRKMNRHEIDKRVKGAAEVLGLADLLKRKPAELSGGQRQRVALGRALVREPAVFLMDEPLSNLDANLRTQMRSEIRRLQQDIGTTTLYVTHDQVEAMTMADRIAVMRDGHLLQVAGLREIYEEPVNMFVAGFLGSPAMSFGRWHAESRQSSVRLYEGQCEFFVSSDGAERWTRSEVLIGVRPEDGHFWEDGGDLVGPIEGRTAMVEVLGREVYVGVDTDAGRYVIETSRGMDRPRLGELVRLGFDKGRLYLFDCESSQSIGRL